MHALERELRQTQEALSNSESLCAQLQVLEQLGRLCSLTDLLSHARTLWADTYCHLAVRVFSQDC